MKALAQFAMGGRLRALALAVASSGSLLFCWIGASLIALTTLRLGPRDGTWLLMWAALPALVMAQVVGEVTPLALLLGTYVLAIVLRLSVSLALAVMVSGVVGVLTGLGLLAFADTMLQQLVEVFAEFLASLQQAAKQAEGDAAVLALKPPGAAQLAGVLGAGNAVLAVLCLCLARYWQAALYNPGGFGSEFRALRLPASASTALAMLALALAWSGVTLRSWAAILLVPLTVQGFAVLHARARLAGRGRGWLGAVYVFWVIFDAAKLIMVALAIIDSWVDLRGRGKRGNGGGQP